MEKAGLLAKYFACAGAESLTMGAGYILRLDPSHAITEENPQVLMLVFVPGEGSARLAPALEITGELAAALAADQQLQPQSASRSSGDQTHV